MKKFSLAGLIATLLILTATVSHAQVTFTTPGVAPTGASGGSAAPTATVSAEIATVLDLAVTSANNVDFNFSGISALDNGIEHDGAVTLTFRSNLPWFVNVAATTPSSGNFAYTGSATTQNAMPVSILQYRLGGTTTFNSMSTTQQSVVGAQGSEQAGGAGTIGVDYKMNPGYVYAPGTYNLTLTYTISNL